VAAITETLPLLESGDRLTRDEFHRIYSLRPDIKKAELVEGVVYVASPLRSDSHGEPHADVITWLGTYRASVPDVRLSDNATVILDGANEPQPDAALWRQGPSVHLDDDGYIEGAPQLIVEVAASSASYDLHDKKEAYRRNGVLEYVVRRTRNRVIDWFRLDPATGDYALIQPDKRGVIESTVFPGLRLSVPKMLAGDLAGVLAELRPPMPSREAGEGEAKA
jgi:Uma2 family endonuclease